MTFIDLNRRFSLATGLPPSERAEVVADKIAGLMRRPLGNHNGETADAVVDVVEIIIEGLQAALASGKDTFRSQPKLIAERALEDIGFEGLMDVARWLGVGRRKLTTSVDTFEADVRAVLEPVLETQILIPYRQWEAAGHFDAPARLSVEERRSIRRAG